MFESGLASTSFALFQLFTLRHALLCLPCPGSLSPHALAILENAVWTVLFKGAINLLPTLRHF
eukprot:6184046-Pleurochrysis_carterae.AAC.2